MNRKLTDFLFIALTVLAFIAGCNWQKKEPCNPEIIRGVPDTVIVTVHVRDTFFMPKPSSARAYHPPVPVTHGPDIAQVVSDTGCLPSDCDSIRDYTLFSRDSSVKVSSSVHGVLLSQVIDAKSSTITINRTDTVIKSPKLVLFGGVNLSKGVVAPGLFVARNKAYLSIHYNLINQMPMVGYGVQLFRSKR